MEEREFTDAEYMRYLIMIPCIILGVIIGVVSALVEAGIMTL